MSYEVVPKRSAEHELDVLRGSLFEIDDADKRVEVIGIAHRREAYR